MRKDSGFSLVEVLVSLAILTIAVAGISSVTAWQARSSVGGNFRSNLLVLKQDLLATIANQKAWDQMKGKNPNMKCLLNNSCKDGDGGLVAIYDVNGNPVYDATNPKAGYTIDLQPCLTYSPNGNDQCPIHVKLSWRAACSSAMTCKTPNELITLTFQTSNSNHISDYTSGLGNLSVVDSYRLNLANDTPVTYCAKQAKYFIGQGNTFGGSNADADGCVPLAAMQGPQGPPGPPGAMGPAGPMGPPGPSTPCTP